MSNNKNKKRKQKKKKNKFASFLFKFIIVVIVIIAAVGISGFSYLNQKISLMTHEDALDPVSVGINSETAKSLKDYKNIALLGIDSRNDDYGLGNRSDCIIIASINQRNGDIQLISVYRDTYIDVLENGITRLDKITHAYSYGRAENTIKSLNEALDLNITEYVTVNFEAVADAVDALGGVTINVTSEELKYINPYIDETANVTGKTGIHLTTAGSQTLNGVQAVSYGRIRYTAGGDYKRTERMRTVIEAVFNKAKTFNAVQLNDFVVHVFPRIYTNIKEDEILDLIPKISSYKIIKSMGWPYEVRGITLDRLYGVPVTLESNVVKLHQEIFEQDDYEVTDTVKEISNRIIERTGYNIQTTE